MKYLSRKEERELFKKMRKGDQEARDKLVESQTDFVYSTAHRLQPILGVSFDDLASEGFVGLLVAIDQFDLSYNVRLSTFSFLWVRAYMIRFANEYRSAVAIPEYVLDLANRYSKIFKKYFEEYKKDPTNEEMIKCLGISEAILGNIELGMGFSIVSIDSEVDSGFDDNLSLHDIIGDKKSEIFERLDDLFEFEIINEAIQSLNERDRFIIESRYGLRGEIKSHRKIGEILNVKPGTVLWLEEQAIEKIKKFISKGVTCL